MFVSCKAKGSMSWRCMETKVDLVMWTYNSEKNLPAVLQRIQEVIPSDCIHRKIISDDNSNDKTREIAKEFGWEVYLNKGKGVNDNTKNALSYVSTSVFCSFEHDIILARDWWIKISKYMDDPTVGVAQGVRVSTNRSFRLIDAYSNRRGDFQHQSLDNNMVKTEIIGKFGYNEVGTPQALAAAGLRWVMDLEVVSDHIRNGMWENIKHDYNMQLYFPDKSFRLKNLRLLLTSPIRAIHMAYKMKSLLMLIVYPLDRLAIFIGSIKKSKKARIA